MYYVYPSYYDRFHCSAGECSHNCCIGWEICIDDITAEKYMLESGKLGSKLKNSIKNDGDGYSFVLDEKGRCPFLLENGLCELICLKGDDYICDICTDHPRFVNSYENRVEIGLGLCCETAAELILEYNDKVVFNSETDIEAESDEECRKILDAEYRLIELAQDRSLKFSERIDRIIEEFDIQTGNISAEYWDSILTSLEKLSDERDLYLHLNRKYDNLQLTDEFQIAFEQLAVYLFYRHIPQALNDGSLRRKISFVVISLYIISTSLCSCGDVTLDNLINICRVFSSEIEYSDNNIDAIINAIE